MSATYTVKIGDRDDYGFRSVIITKGSVDGEEVDSWERYEAHVFPSINQHGYKLGDYLGNSTYEAERI